MERSDLVNHGFIVRPGTAPETGAGGRTFVISGVARSGTTMAAAVLREAGLFLGNALADVVHEDRELLAILQSGQRQLLAAAIARRNAEHRDWGFKIPNLHAYLGAEDFARFRNPQLVVLFRDPVAVSVRNAISEMFDPFDSMTDTASAQVSVLEFVRGANCRSLLVSYEKALIFPERFVEALTEFCGLSPDAATVKRLVRLVEPNPHTYVQRARRRFAGAIDTVRSGVLHGWCCQIDELAPVSVDVFLDDERWATVKADRFRPDLRAAGYGNGNHGFAVNLAALGAGDEALLRVAASGRTFVLPNSGKRLRDYAAGGSDAAGVKPAAPVPAG